MELGSWNVVEGRLVKELEFANQTDVARFVLKVATMSDEMEHHADLELYEWRKLRLSISTHDAGNVITETDHAWAAKVDAFILAD